MKINYLGIPITLKKGMNASPIEQRTQFKNLERKRGFITYNQARMYQKSVSTTKSAFLNKLKSRTMLKCLLTVGRH